MASIMDYLPYAVAVVALVGGYLAYASASSCKSISVGAPKRNPSG